MDGHGVGKPLMPELSDAQVFGDASPRELSDADVFGPSAASMTEAPPGNPRFEARKRTFGERFHDNFEQGRQQTIFGAGADALSANILDEQGNAASRARLQDENERYRIASEADPWYEADGLLGKAEAGIATLAGILAGGMTSPEALAGPGKTVVGRIVGNAAVNAAADVPTQLLQNEAGNHEGFDPGRVAMSGATGAVLQGGGEALGAGAKAGVRAARPYVEAGGRKAQELAETAARKLGEVADSVGERPVPGRDRDFAVELSDSDVFGATRGDEAPSSPHRAEVRSDAEVFGDTVELPDRHVSSRSIQTPAEIGSLVGEILPGAKVTSGFRTRKHNVEVGGARNSFHTRGKGQAVDVVLPAGADRAAFRQALEARGVKIAEFLDEGDHVHVAWEAPAPGRSTAVTSATEAPDALVATRPGPAQVWPRRPRLSSGMSARHLRRKRTSCRRATACGSFPATSSSVFGTSRRPAIGTTW